MKIIKPYFIVETKFSTIDIFKTIELVGRNAYKSEDKITKDSSEKFIQMILDRGHYPVLEFYDIVVRVICDRGVTHEIVRHRLASYVQESTRYCNFSKDKFGNEITVIKPIFWDEDDPKYKVWWKAMMNSEMAYMQLISMGASAQEARSVLPNSLKTEICIKMNLREWMHFFKMRTAPNAHPQMKEIAVPLLHEFQKKIPYIFDNI